MKLSQEDLDQLRSLKVNIKITELNSKLGASHAEKLYLDAVVAQLQYQTEFLNIHLKYNIDPTKFTIKDDGNIIEREDNEKTE